jgi:hypothetical protein
LVTGWDFAYDHQQLRQIKKVSLLSGEIFSGINQEIGSAAGFGHYLKSGKNNNYIKLRIPLIKKKP